MELVDYLRVVRRRWVLIALAALVCTGSALGASLLRSPIYETTSQLVVTGRSSGLLDELALRQVAVARAGTYATYASTRPAITAALKGAGYSPDGPAPSIVGSADGATPFLRITASDTDPVRAAAVANAYADTFLDVVAQIDGRERAVDNVLTVLDVAPVPTAPVSPDPPRDALLGLILGLVLGVVAAFVREALDRVYRDADVLENDTRLSVLGVVPLELPKVQVPTLTHPMSGRAEAYRTVRTNVQFAGPGALLKRIVVTSATPGDGKTAVATNLAVAFARTGQSVVLIDADMRRPRAAQAFGRGLIAPGLSDVLGRGLPLDEAVQVVPEAGVALLAAGGRVANPSELLGSPRMAEVLSQLEGQFDVVILDCPPVLPVSDPLVLAVNATGVIVVVRLGTTSRDRLRRALASLAKLNVPILGLVANGAVAGGDAAYGYGAKYGYDQTPIASGRRGRRRDRQSPAVPTGAMVSGPSDE